MLDYGGSAAVMLGINARPSGSPRLYCPGAYGYLVIQSTATVWFCICAPDTSARGFRIMKNGF